MFDRPRFHWSCALALLLAACAGPGAKVTPLSLQEIPIPPTLTPTPLPVEVPPSVIQSVPPEKPLVAKPGPQIGWISLNDWCAENKIQGPFLKTSNTETNLEIRSEHGTFVFELPRRNVRWNGTLLGIGFTPHFTNGHAMANAIDLAKVLQPLLLPETAPKRKAGGIVVIDAGHGGANVGALSHDGKLREKDLTLDWAKRVQKLLEGSRWQAILTRQADLDLTTTQRVDFAELNKADLFISLHFNSYSGQKESGLETYCYTPPGMASHLTRDYPDEINSIAPNNQFDVENLLLAHDLHLSLLKNTKRQDRGIRRARFMTVLRGQARPAVLLEGGYLSNPEEARLIGSPEYRQKLAEAVVEALGVKLPTFTAARE